MTNNREDRPLAVTIRAPRTDRYFAFVHKREVRRADRGHSWPRDRAGGEEVNEGLSPVASKGGWVDSRVHGPEPTRRAETDSRRTSTTRLECVIHSSRTSPPSLGSDARLSRERQSLELNNKPTEPLWQKRDTRGQPRAANHGRIDPPNGGPPSQVAFAATACHQPRSPSKAKAHSPPSGRSAGSSHQAGRRGRSATGSGRRTAKDRGAGSDGLAPLSREKCEKWETRGKSSKPLRRPCAS